MRHRVVAPGITAACVAVMLAVAAPASAYWQSSGTGFASVATGTLSPPTAVVAVVDDATTVSISWVASSGALVPDGYYVERIGSAGSVPACDSDADSLLVGTACIDEGLAAGDYSYSVTAVFRSWTARSADSAAITLTDSLLGAAASFSVLGNAVTTTGFTRVSGDLGVSPGSAVVGFPDGIVDGEIHAGDQAAADAQAALVAAYTALWEPVGATPISGDLVGQVLDPGVYYAGAALGLTGALTLDGGGDPNATFVILVNAAITPAAGSSVVLINGASAANVYWVVNAAVTIGALSDFVGTILAQGAIGMGAGAQLIGRALSRDAVTMADNIVRFTTELPPELVVTGGPSAVTKDTTPTISGTTTTVPGRIVTVSIAGQVLTGTVQPDQTWSVTAGELLADTYAIVAKVEDAAGNGTTAAQSLVVEVNPPTIALGLAAPFAILAGTTVTATGASTVTGDVGVSPGTSITGLSPTSVDGEIHAGDLTAADALTALAAAIADASGRRPHTQFGGDMVGRVFHAGVHHSSAAIGLTGVMTLDAEGDENAVFIFQVDAAMGTAASSSVVLANGAQASNVFWVVDAAVDTGALASLPGTILATGTITLGAGTQLTGRALTMGAIVMADTTIAAP